MGTLFGRDAELARARAVLNSAARGQIVRAVRIVGTSGVGKTALAQALAAEASASGWLAVWVPGYRIHEALSLFAARRVLQTLMDSLGETAGRYSSGLTIDRERPEDFEEAFLGIIEGVTLDHRLLLVLDDAQWTDAESRALIERTIRTLADRAIVLLSTERSEEGPAAAFTLSDEAIALDALSQQAALEIVREIYPSVSDDVAKGIASETRGRAADVVAVATAARDGGATTLRDVSASTRRVVARDIALLDAELRGFLQICALIEEPIELTLLEQMWPKNELFLMIEQTLGRYLLSDGGQLRFVHATVMESVLETIPIEIPMRHRVIEALKALPEPRLEDYERMAKQCAACGDISGERDALVKLSHEAAAKSINTLSAEALERALAIAPPKRDEIIATHARLSQMYNVTAREADAIRISRIGIAEANAAGLSDGLGPLVASIVIGQWHSGLNDEARATLAYYEQKLTSDEDRANLFSVGEFISMHCLDVESAARYRAQFERYAPSAVPIAMIRHHISNAYIAMRTGDGQAGLALIDVADRAVASAGGVDTIMPLVARILHAFHFRGVTAADQLVSQAGQERKISIATTIRCQIMISRGELEDAEEVAADNLRDAADSHSRHGLLGARYTAAALRRLDESHPSWEAAWNLVARFETGERSAAILPIVAAALVPLSLSGSARGRKLLHDVIHAAREPMDAMTFQYPVLLAIAARSLGVKDALESIAAQGTWSDSQPWNRAQQLLARGVASSALAGREAGDLLETARAHFMALGSTYFASLASETINQRMTSARDGVKRPNNTTRREGEIAALVAEGLTNREIAEKLVLSERTIEGHVANLFAKCNVNSRTQLATWFLRNFSSAS